MTTRTTTDGKPPTEGVSGAPQPIDPATGQHKAYWILSPSERAKGYVRPVRRKYRHMGPTGNKYPLEPLSPEDEARYAGEGYVGFERYPESESPLVGMFWTQAQLDAAKRPACRTETTMAQSIAETYAAQPTFYGSTFCMSCREHFPVNEFVWVSDPEERVGS